MVSIIVPVYNVEQYIATCLDSALKQDYNDFELIIIDDGSQDKSAYISETYVKDNEKVTVIHKHNKGLSSARNVGLDICQGDFIFFLDSDDFISRDALKTTVDYIIHTNVDIVAFPFYINEIDKFFGSKTKSVRRLLNKEVEIVSSVDVLNRFDTFWEYPLIVAWNKLYRKRIFETIRFSEGVFHEDEYAIIDILKSCGNICCITTPLYYYVLSPNSIMRNASFAQNEKKTKDYINMCYLRALKFKELKIKRQEYLSYIEYIGSYIKSYRKLKNTPSNKDYFNTQNQRMRAILKDDCFKSQSSTKSTLLLYFFIFFPYISSVLLLFKQDFIMPLVRALIRKS